MSHYKIDCTASTTKNQKCNVSTLKYHFFNLDTIDFLHPYHRCGGTMIMWNIMRCITLHFIWRDWNKVMFDRKLPTSTTPALASIYTTFSAHLCFLLRQDLTVEDQLHVAATISQLMTYPSFDAYFKVTYNCSRFEYLKISQIQTT